MAKKVKEPVAKAVDPEQTAEALAKAVAEGDIVNFRQLFISFSPARKTSGEGFETDKYAYMRAEGERDARFEEALALVRRAETWTHIERELDAERPPQLPSELLMLLADNAVREGKFTSAAQAYELLRVRRKIQNEFMEQGDRALDGGEISAAVTAYLIGVGLAYDYAAFPEPLSMVPNYQAKALMIHGTYPTQPEDCVALAEENAHVNAALEYLLYDGECAARLRDRPIDQRLDFLVELIRRMDAEWEVFAERYRGGCAIAREYGERLDRIAERGDEETLEEEIEGQQSGDPGQIMADLLGREIPEGEWWQYLKEIAYEHPAGILFVSRLMFGEREILVPRFRADSRLAGKLNLVPATSDTQAAGA